MSRHIDLDNLTDADLAYLAQRTWLVDDAVQQGFTDLPDRIRALDHASLAGVKHAPQLDIDDDEVYDITYAEASVAQLRAELEHRGLATNGKKAELIARLEEDDESDEDEEDDEVDDEEEAE